MRVAVFSDVQANLPALETCVAHIQGWNPDLVVMAGDLINRGPRSDACLGLFQQGDMIQPSLLGGLALANAGLGAVHGIASVVGGMFAAPHGAICARLLPAVMAANVADSSSVSDIAFIVTDLPCRSVVSMSFFDFRHVFYLSNMAC